MRMKILLVINNFVSNLEHGFVGKIFFEDTIWVHYDKRGTDIGENLILFVPLNQII